MPLYEWSKLTQRYTMLMVLCVIVANSKGLAVSKTLYINRNPSKRHSEPYHIILSHIQTQLTCILHPIKLFRCFSLFVTNDSQRYIEYVLRLKNQFRQTFATKLYFHQLKSLKSRQYHSRCLAGRRCVP